ncbi:MAG TPA: hypothetical protein VJ787_00165 [Thermoleophilia bacterium]|nr:hypothetical protein [Thermoleophilia bacterium]
MVRKRQTAAVYIERYDGEMQDILGELAEHADMIRTWWNLARDQVREDPDQALQHLVDAQIHLDIHVRIERVGALRRIRLASNRLDAELPDDDEDLPAPG